MTQGRDTGALALARAELSRSGAPFSSLPERFLLVERRAPALDPGRRRAGGAEFPVSTRRPAWAAKRARFALRRAGTASIPNRRRRAARRRVREREDTGKRWGGESSSEDLILTRILWLDGSSPSSTAGRGAIRCRATSTSRYESGGPARPGGLARLRAHGQRRRRLALRSSRRGRRARRGRSGIARRFPTHWRAAASTTRASAAVHERTGRSFRPCRAAWRAAATAASTPAAETELRGRLSASASCSIRRTAAASRETVRRLPCPTAVEAEVPDLRARAAAHPGRPPLRAAGALRRPTTARCGGGHQRKSSVVAMISDPARQRPASLGDHRGELIALQRLDLRRQRVQGPDSNLLVVEADESDGSLVRYTRRSGWC